jgi:hypothetical protein
MDGAAAAYRTRIPSGGAKAAKSTVDFELVVHRPELSTRNNTIGSIGARLVSAGRSGYGRAGHDFMPWYVDATLLGLQPPADGGLEPFQWIERATRRQGAPELKAGIAGPPQEGGAGLGKSVVSDRSDSARPFPSRGAVAAAAAPNCAMLLTTNLVEPIATWLSCK